MDVLSWGRDGKELIVRSPDDQLTAIRVDARGESISATQSTPLFKLPANHGRVAMMADGDRFLVAEYPYAASQTIHVLTNWQKRIK